MIKRSFALACLSLLGLSPLVYAATPVAVWDGNFNSLTCGNYTIDLQGNTPVLSTTATEGGATITNAITIADANLGVLVKKNSGKYDVVTVLTRCEGIDLSSSSEQTLFVATSPDYTTNTNGNNLVGVRLTASNAAVKGIWVNGKWDTVTGSALTNTYTTLAFKYNRTGGTYLYAVTTNEAGTVSCSAIYSASGLKSSGYYPNGVAIGGLNTGSIGSLTAAKGMKISAIAIFEGEPSTDEMASYSILDNWLFATNVSGTVEWNNMTCLHKWADDAALSNAVITLTGDATITLPENFSANKILFAGNYNVTLKEASGVTTMSPISSLSGGKSITREIPDGFSSSSTIFPAGITYRVCPGSSVSIGGKCVLSGVLTVDKGATLTALSNDVPNYNSPFALHIYGTLELGNYRWTMLWGGLHVYGGAIINGTGDGYGAVDLHSNIFAHKGADDSSTEIKINAPVRYSKNSATINVDEGVTVTLAQAGKSGNDTSLLTKAGAGTLVFGAAQSPLNGTVKVTAGTLVFDCESAISGKVNLASGATLKVTKGTYDLSSHTLDGTVVVTGGTVTVSSTMAGKASESDSGTIKVAVTAEEWANGVTIETSKVTLRSGHTNLTFVYDGVEVEGTGMTLVAQSREWTGTGDDNKWSTAANWSDSTLPTAANAVTIKKDATIEIAETDVMPKVISIGANVTLKGSISSVKAIPVSEGKTLTLDGSAAITSLSGAGTVVLAEGTVVTTPNFHVLIQSFTGLIKGAGAIKYTSMPSSSAVTTFLQNAEKWQATFSLENLAYNNFNPNLLGNTNSVLRLTGCSGYFIQSNGEKKSSPMTIAPTIELVNGTGDKEYGYKCVNGSSGDQIEFAKVIGSGLFLVTEPGGQPTRRLFFNDVSAFAGTIKVQGSDSGRTTIYLGRSRDGYTNDDDRDNMNIFICKVLPEAVRVVNERGQIIIANEFDTKSMTGLQEKVLTWETVPTTTCAVGTDLAARWRAQKRTDGLYLVRKNGFMILIQ